MSDTTLRNYITKIPTVQANGDFSMELYRQMLAAQGLTMNGFEAGVRRDLAIGRVLEPVGMTARAPAEVVASLETALTQTRTVQLRRFAAADYRSKVDVSPADIQAWYDANKQQLQIPEQVQVQYLVLDEAAATQGVQVKDEDLASYYEQNKTRFGQPERRRVSHIMINLPAGARKMRARRLAPRPTSWTSWPWPTRPSSPNWPARNRRTPAPPPMAATWAGSRRARCPARWTRPPSA